MGASLLEVEMPEHKDLTLPLARQLLMLSYFFSQGLPAFQDALIRYIAVWLRPGWRMSDRDCAALRGLAPSILALPERGVHQLYNLSVSEVYQDVDDERLVMWRAFQGPESQHPGDRCEMVTQLMDWFYSRDWRFLVEVGQRVRVSSASYSSNPHRDEHLSLFCHYILLRNSSGCPVFDELLADVAAEVARRGGVGGLLADPDRRERLAGVLEQHNRWHPHAQIVVPSPCPAIEKKETDQDSAVSGR